MFSFQLRISRKSTGPTSSEIRNRPRASIPNTARPFFVYEVSKKFTLPWSSWYTFSRYDPAFVTALKMFGSKSGSSENVLAKQPFSLP